MSGFNILFHKIDVVIWVNKSDGTHLRFMSYHVALGGPDSDVSIFLLKALVLDTYLLLLLRSCSPYAFFLIKYGPLKGYISSCPSFCINHSLAYLLSIPHTKYVSFRYVGENFFDI